MKKYIPIIFSLLAAISAQAQNVVTDTIGFRTAAAGNVAELLRGELAGVRVSSMDGNPVGGLNVNIRGINSLRTDNQPLWIVDGVMVSTDLNENLDAFWQYGEKSYTAPLNPLAFLNANEIESIEVLKDVSATTIYGARGANGVVIVKTKMPQKGEKNIALSTNAGLSLDASSTGLKPKVSHNHYLSFNGTNGSTRYNISGTFRNINGIVGGNRSNYGSLKANFDTQANKVVWFGFNAIMSAGASSSTTGVSYLGRPSAMLALRDPALSPTTSFENWMKDYDDDTEDYRALASMYFQLNFTPALSLRADAGLDFQNNKRIIWYGQKTDFGAISLENDGGGAAGNLFSQLVGFNGNLTLSYNRYIALDHHVVAKLVGEVVGNKNKFNTMNGINFVSQTLRGRGLKLGAYDVRNHDFLRNYSHYGGYGYLSYEYKDIAGINGTFRVDYTPKYGKNEVNFYPAVDAYVDFHKAFLPDFDAVSTIRLKGGWGKSGKEKYVPYELFGSYLSGAWYEPAAGTTTFYDGLDRLKTKEWHVSIEAGFLSDRLLLSAGWFDRSTNDSFVMYKLGKPQTIGSGKIWEWGGCERVFERATGIANRGLEFALKAEIIKSADWGWTLSANMTYSENRVTSYDPQDFHGRKVGSGIYCTCNGLNMPVSCLYGYNVDESGKLKDMTGDKRVDEADMVVLGRTIPTLYGGLQTVLRFRNFTLEALLDGAAGHDVANVNTLIRDGKKDANGVSVLTSDFVEKGDYLRISEVGLKYNIPVKAKWMKGLEARISAHNLATFTKYSGWNPDVNCFGVSSLANGLDYGSYPMSRLVMIGISAKF